MNPPFPEAAEPVRQKIRELVERPKELPEPNSDGSTKLVWPGYKCPWMMLPSGSKGETAHQFWDWWDSCRSAQEAVDTVWGKA